MNGFKPVIDEISNAKNVVVIQAENPDGDSLATSLALEAILSELGLNVKLYCPVQIPRHLRFLDGWDRVEEELPKKFDLSIIVDTSSAMLLEKVFTAKQLPRLRAHPTVVIDHHTNDIDLPYETVNALSESAAATGELVYDIAKQAGWKIPNDAAEFIATSIMFDTLGMTTESTTPKTVRLVADLIESGVSLAKLDNARRQLNKKSIELVRYKAELMNRIEYSLDNQLAEIVIPWEDIQQYSDQYNPSMLVLDEMRMTEDVKIAIAYKEYPDGKITAKIRTNYGYEIADTVAELFGGGGHPYAAGFKLRDKSLQEIRAEVKQQLVKIFEES